MLQKTLAALSILSLAVPFASADHIDVTIATDKAAYTPGEALRFHVTAHNPTDKDVTLNFGSSLQAVYIIDGTSQFPHFGRAVLTHRNIPANGSYTWTYRQNWSDYPVALGDHSVVGRVFGVGNSSASPFTIVPPTLPADDFLLNFDTLPGTDTPMTSIDETWPYGVHFRSKSSGQGRPNIYVSNDNTNTYVGVMSTTYPPGFNIIADFDMPVHGATVNVSSAEGLTVTMIARGRDGDLLASVTSDPIISVGDFTQSLSLESIGDIHSLEWWPSQENASVMIDNLAITLPDPGLLPMTVAALAFLSRRRRRPPCDCR